MQCSAVWCSLVCSGVSGCVWCSFDYLSSLGVGQAADGDGFHVELEGVDL